MSVATAIAAIAHPKGQHRMADENARLQYRLDKSSAANQELRRRLIDAIAAEGKANAKANRLSGIEETAAEATRRLQAQTAELYELRAFYANATKVGDLGAHPAVTETQPIPVLPLHQSPLAGTSPSHVPGRAR